MSATLTQASTAPSAALHPAWGRRAIAIFFELCRWVERGRIVADEDIVRIVPAGVLRRLEARGAVIVPGGDFPPIAGTQLMCLIHDAVIAGDIS